METRLFASLICARTGAPGVARFDRVGNRHLLIGTSSQRPGSSPPKHGSKGANLGEVDVSDTYSGCPSCGAPSFFQCFVCFALACYNGTDRHVTCPSCHGDLVITPGGIQPRPIAST